MVFIWNLINLGLAILGWNLSRLVSTFLHYKIIILRFSLGLSGSHNAINVIIKLTKIKNLKLIWTKIKDTRQTNLVMCFLIMKYEFQLFVLNHLLNTRLLLFILYTLANFFNFSKVYVFNLRSIDQQQDEHLTFL